MAWSSVSISLHVLKHVLFSCPLKLWGFHKWNHCSRQINDSEGERQFTTEVDDGDVLLDCWVIVEEFALPCRLFDRGDYMVKGSLPCVSDS